ncbi:carbon storage regulator [Paenibacillus mesophilus]|nr:carbon storage regulator [Paenibacillus mesophilus]TMV42799.1 carbon storage regulator [Paenibacillus mesophilus]
MLVVGRKAGQYVMIGNEIKVQVVRTNDGDLRLAIDVPKEVSVYRGEVYEKTFADRCKQI